jgi:hypothetical protein
VGYTGSIGPLGATGATGIVGPVGPLGATGATGVSVTFTYGTSYALSYSNLVWFFDDTQNYFDVFPPGGKSMSNLVAFIPSIAIIYWEGTVNRDDALRCIWNNLGDRIRVWVQNTEQRSLPAANWLAVWS